MAEITFFPFPRTDAISAEEVVRIYDEEIQKHKTHIKTLENLRNAFVPIFRLPPEVLCRIFSFATSQYTDTIRVIHICRHWRNVALNSPSLWTRPPLHSAFWTEQWLARSKMANLVLDISCGHETSVAILSEIFSLHASRISNLNMSWPARLAGSVLDMLPRSMPMLESFVFYLGPVYQTWGGQQRRRLPSIPDDCLLDNGRMWRLKLMAIAINWNTHLHGGLTHLSLYDVPVSTLPTITQFWDALERMPLLQILDIKNSFPVVEKVTPRQGATKFLYLQSLILELGPKEAQTLLSGINFPSTTKINVNCKTNDDNTLPDFTDLVSSVACLLKKPIRLLEICFSLPGIDLRAFETPFPGFVDWMDDGDSEESFLELSLYWNQVAPGSGLDIDIVMMELFRELPLREVTQLRVDDGDGRLPAYTILRSYGALPNLQTLITKFYPSHLHVLRQNLPSSGSSDSSHDQIEAIPFPSLHSIFMPQTSFTLIKYAGTRSINTTELADCLQLRQKHGASIQTLNLDGCLGLTRESVSLLRKSLNELNVQIEWDEAERPSNSYTYTVISANSSDSSQYELDETDSD